MKPHLWRGQWLDDDELANQLPHLATQLAADLDRPPPLSALLQAAQALGQSLQQEGGAAPAFARRLACRAGSPSR